MTTIIQTNETRCKLCGITQVEIQKKKNDDHMCFNKYANLLLCPDCNKEEIEIQSLNETTPTSALKLKETFSKISVNNNSNISFMNILYESWQEIIIHDGGGI